MTMGVTSFTKAFILPILLCAMGKTHPLPILHAKLGIILQKESEMFKLSLAVDQNEYSKANHVCRHLEHSSTREPRGRKRNYKDSKSASNVHDQNEGFAHECITF
jgi:hypothetical protein